MKRARSRRRAPVVESSDSDTEPPSLPKPPSSTRAPSTASTSVAELLVKQAADHKPQPLDLSGIDPAFWAPVDAAGVASAVDTPAVQCPTWLLNVAESTRYQSSFERAVDVLESAPSACATLEEPTALPPAATQAEPPAVPGSAYVTHLRAVVDHALSSASCAGLLTPEERRLARAFLDLDHPAASLMARLFQRKGPWFRVSALRYAEMTGRRGWWEREEGDAVEAAAPLPPIHGLAERASATEGQKPSAASNDYAVDSGVQAATTAVAVRALIDVGFLIPLPGAGAPAATATTAGSNTASPAPVNAFARLMGGGGARAAQVSASSLPPTPSSSTPSPATGPPPEPLLLALEAAHSCCTAPELRAILAQVGGKGVPDGTGRA